MYTFYNSSPYLAAPVATIVGGLVAMSEYELMLKPLQKKDPHITSLIVATLGLDVVFTGVLGIYSDILLYNFKIFNSKQFLLASADFSAFEVRGIVYVAPILLSIITLALYLLLTKTRFGISMRATVENPKLALVLGINTNQVYRASWLLAGAVAGLAGSLFVLWFPASPTVGDDFIISIFAGSIVGGFFNIFGAIFGGLLIGLAQVLGTFFLANYFGSWVLKYQLAVPIILIAAFLLLAPQGVTSMRRPRNWFRRRNRDAF